MKNRNWCVLSIMLSLFTILCCLFNSGCNLLESPLQNVNSWDISACVSGFDTCWELFWDNSEKFEDGFVDAMDTLFPE